MLGPVIRYLGLLPILFNIFVTRAGAAEFLDGSTHQFHLDPEDATTVKVFIHLSDVDPDCGPFHALPADLSARTLEATGYGRGRLADEAVAAVVGPGAAVPSLGPAGFATWCDTTRCLHFGGRPRAGGKPPRDMLLLHYLSPTSNWYPLPGEAAEPPNRMSRLQPKAGDDAWNAFIGAQLL